MEAPISAIKGRQSAQRWPSLIGLGEGSDPGGQQWLPK